MSFEGGSGSCWVGGSITGNYPAGTTWDAYHSTGAFNFTNPSFTVSRLRVHGYGDSIRAREGASGFVIRDVHVTDSHDDCVENDRLYSGVVKDSLFDGCYVAFSARPSSSDLTSDGRNNVWTFERNLVRLQPMPTVYKGAAPGHGGIFKWETGSGRSPKLAIRNNIFRVDQLPNHGSLGLPAGYAVTDCSNNVVVWLGAGPFPEALPSCFTVTTDRSVWDNAVAAWLTARSATTTTTVAAPPTTTTTVAAPPTTTTTVAAPPTTTTTVAAPPTTTTTVAAPPTTTTTVAAPPTTTTTLAASPVSADSCLSLPTVLKVVGNQSGRFSSNVSASTVVDARLASWSAVDNWPVSFEGGSGSCWVGGSITGNYPAGTTWDAYHSTGAFNFTNPSFTVSRLRVHGYGDSIRAREGASGFVIRDVHVTDSHDDCVENDRLYSGVVKDSLFDGCYVAFSARPSSSDLTSDGRNNVWTFERNLVRLQPMPTVYKGAAPGHGGIFKWETGSGRSPKLAIRNNIFRVDQLPNHGSLGLPAGYAVTDCSNNVVVWLGAGPFPEALPSCFTVTTDRSVWDNAVVAWLTARSA